MISPNRLIFLLEVFQEVYEAMGTGGGSHGNMPVVDTFILCGSLGSAHPVSL